MNMDMSQSNNILVATDFSPAAQQAVERAAHLARATNCGLCLLHVFNDTLWHSLTSVFAIDHWRGEKDPALIAREALSQQAREIGQRFSLPVTAECLTGRPAALLADYARESGARLLVAGLRGESSLDEVLIGGTALKILARSTVPVYLVRTSTVGVPARILVAVDDSDAAAARLQQVGGLFPEARLTVFRSYEVPCEGRMRLAGATEDDIRHYRETERERTIRWLGEFIAALPASLAQRCTARQVRGFPAPAILQEAEAMHADLVAVGRHAGGLGEERLLGSVTQNVLYHARSDVLLLP